MFARDITNNNRPLGTNIIAKLGTPVGKNEQNRSIS